MTNADVAGVMRVQQDALLADASMPAEPTDRTLGRMVARVEHLLATDPEGAWVATHDGAVIGVAMALVREGLWGLSLLAVAPERQAQGIGRRLLDATSECAAGTRGRMILSSEDPKAMRRYARAGLELRPCLDAAGIVDRSRLPAPDPRVRVGTTADVESTATASRFVRGASHAGDLPVYTDHGMRLLLFEDRGFACHVGGSPRLLAATDEEAAAALLWACLADAPPGATTIISFLTAGQDWAIAVALEAGLALSPAGPVCVSGDVGPLRPYVPNGAFL